VASPEMAGIPYFAIMFPVGRTMGAGTMD